MSKVFAIRLPLSDSREGNWHPSAEPLGCIVWELRSQHQIAALIQVYDTTHDTAVTTHAQNKQRLDDGADILSRRTRRHAAFAINTWSKVRRSNGWSGEKTCLFFSDWDQISFHFTAPPHAPPPNLCFFVCIFLLCLLCSRRERSPLPLSAQRKWQRPSFSFVTHLSLSHFPLSLTQSVRALLIAIHFSLAFTLAIRLSLPIHPSISLDKTCFLLSHFPSQNRGFKGKEGGKKF